MVALQVRHPPEHGAVRPPRAPEDVEDGEAHGDRDPLQHAEQGHAGEGRAAQQELRTALPPQPYGPGDVGQGQRRRDDDGGEGRLGEVAEQARSQHEHQDDERRPDDAGELGPGPRPLRDRRTGPAGADGEALEETGRQVGRADARHLLVAADLLPRTGREGRRVGDRVGQRHQGDADGPAQQQWQVGEPHGGDGERREALGQFPDQVDTVLAQAEDDGRGDRQDDHHEHRRDLRQEALQHQDDEDPADADRGGGRDRRPVGEAPHDAGGLADQTVRVDREAEQLGELTDQDGQRQPVHVADHRRPGDQICDEAELRHRGQDHQGRHHQREHRRQRHRPVGIPAGGHHGQDGGGDHRPQRRIRSQHQDPGRPEHRVAEQAEDRRVQPGDGRQARQLGVRHALRNQQRGQHDTRHQVLDEPLPPVRRDGPGPGYGPHPGDEPAVPAPVRRGPPAHQALRDRRATSLPSSHRSRRARAASTAQPNCRASISVVPRSRRKPSI